MATATVLKPRVRDIGERPHRWTRYEVYALSDAGLFADKRISLINGRIVVMPLPGPRHEYLLDTLLEYLASVIPVGHFPRLSRALGISQHNDPGPDLAIVPGNRHAYESSHPTRAIFAAEIAVTTLSTDMGAKAFLYAKGGVPEYWVVDDVNRRLIVHRDPIRDDAARFGHRYASILTLTEADVVSPSFAPTARIVVADIFKKSVD